VALYLGHVAHPGNTRNLAASGGLNRQGRVPEFLPMVMPRNRQRTSLEDRLLEFAKEARTAATLVVPGREQDELLRKARKAEMLASATDRLTLADPY
jgi:hypothetical protein